MREDFNEDSWRKGNNFALNIDLTKPSDEIVREIESLPPGQVQFFCAIYTLLFLAEEVGKNNSDQQQDFKQLVNRLLPKVGPQAPKEYPFPGLQTSCHSDEALTLWHILLCSGAKPMWDTLGAQVIGHFQTKIQDTQVSCGLVKAAIYFGVPECMKSLVAKVNVQGLNLQQLKQILDHQFVEW